MISSKCTCLRTRCGGQKGLCEDDWLELEPKELPDDASVDERLPRRGGRSHGTWMSSSALCEVLNACDVG